MTNKEMVALYDNGMVRRRDGRAIYDDLMTAHPTQRCSFCGHRTVSTLDHHLPKTVYSALTVVPSNLVPACKDCNKIKGTRTPATATEEPIHPYFEDLEADLWLHARVEPLSPATFVFFVSAPDAWSPTLAARVRNHFFDFELDFFYGALAADELIGIRGSLIDHFGAGGAEGTARVVVHLQREAASRHSARVNSWQTAMYSAMASDAWFCSGGFQ
ncbi:HNH endonuclease [Geodermatophilus africanus]|uniref:HNH endonuclease n=1 Tax=Geodermatophilus africanus TaxID=1137993 RepID=UPI0011150162|nr:HNH endonuclease [Geodermatophilus africanus]